jgi:phage shock protein A
MNSTLLHRLKRIIARHFSSWVSKFQDGEPETEMLAALEEAESAIRELQAQIGRANVQRHQLTKVYQKYEAQAAELQEQARVLLLQHNPEQARITLGKLVPLESTLSNYRRNLSTITLEIQSLHERVGEALAGKEDMKVQFNQFRQAKARKEQPERLDPEVAAISPEGLFSGNSFAQARLRFRRALNETDPTLEVDSTLAQTSHPPLKELEELHQKALVEEKLAALQSSLKKS